MPYLKRRGKDREEYAGLAPAEFIRKQDEPLTTACGGNLVKGEINRNKQSPLCGVATIEAAGMDMSGYEISMICIAAMTLLLKLIEFILNQTKK